MLITSDVIPSYTGRYQLTPAIGTACCMFHRLSWLDDNGEESSVMQAHTLTANMVYAVLSFVFADKLIYALASHTNFLDVAVLPTPGT